MPVDAIARRRIPVLLYHRIDTDTDRARRPFCVAPGQFAAQMRWLAEQGFQTIDLHAMLDYYELNRPVPERAMVITFDDGYFCNYSRAFAIMSEHGFTGTIFLAANLMRAEQAKPMEGSNSFMSWPEVREMQDHGWSFQSHGLDHLIMTEIPPAQMRREIIESRRIIAEQLGQTVDFFCYPFAGFDESVEQAVRAAGYRGACGGPPFYENGPVSHYAIGRTEILEQDSFTQFRFKIRQGLGYYYFTLRQLGKVKRVFSRAW